MRGAEVEKMRIKLFAFFFGNWATRVKAASAGQIDRVGRFALQDDAFFSQARVGDWNDGEQGLRIWMFGIFKHGLHTANFNNAP